MIVSRNRRNIVKSSILVNGRCWIDSGTNSPDKCLCCRISLNIIVSFDILCIRCYTVGILYYHYLPRNIIIASLCICIIHIIWDRSVRIILYELCKRATVCVLRTEYVKYTLYYYNSNNFSILLLLSKQLTLETSKRRGRWYINSKEMWYYRQKNIFQKKKILYLVFWK